MLDILWKWFETIRLETKDSGKIVSRRDPRPAGTGGANAPPPAAGTGYASCIRSRQCGWESYNNKSKTKKMYTLLFINKYIYIYINKYIYNIN